MRSAFRSLIRRPAYTTTVVMLLAMGIGANTAIFGIVDAVLLRPLPYADPDSVVVVFADGSARGQGAQVATTPGDLFDWQSRSGPVFAALSALRNVSPRITSLDTPVVPLTHAVTANYFELLGAAPLLGRTFRAGEDEPGRDGVVMLSYGLWQSKFGGDPAVVGRTIDLDARPYTVVGVMGRDFYSANLFNVRPDLWIPHAYGVEREDRATRDVLVYGRLRPGVSLAAARPAMRAVAADVAKAHPQTGDRWSVALVPIREYAVGGFTRLAAIVLCAVGLVLVIACANVANLTLARGIDRAADVAVRAALGAGRGRILVELAAESILLAGAGAAIGTGVAAVMMPALVSLIPPSAGVPFLHRAVIDARVVTFEVVTAIACATIAAVLPARQALQLDVVEALRTSGRGRLSPSAGRWRAALVGAEVAIAVVVVACAALMTETLVGLERVPTGFQADRIAKVRTSLRGEAFAAAASRIRHFEELQRKLADIPGVASASAASFEPPNPEAQISAVRIRIPGRADDAASAPSAVGRAVLPDYFDTMGIPIASGRGITRDDRAEAAPVAVISQSMAHRYFEGLDPIGRTFAIEAPRAVPLRVVGVSGDVITAGVDPTPQPTFYLAYAQFPAPVMTMVMRVAKGDAAAPLRQAEQIAWSISPFTNVYFPETMDQRMRDLNWRTRFAVVVLGGFALAGLLLAAAGLYAVMAYGVAQRRAEIGLRKALGADSRAIVMEIGGDGMRTVLVGLAIGNVAALAAARALSGLLYGVAPSDPATLVAVSVVMLVVAACATAVPAWTASKVEPQMALRT